MLSIIFDAFRNGNFDFFLLISFFLSAITVIFIGSPIHEFSHALIATKLGDPTPRYQGRTTLNPLAHIDPRGAILILLFGFGWAKPVSVNTRYFRYPKRDMALTALAGPVSNILMAFIFYIAYKLLSYLPDSEFMFYFSTFFYYVIQINISLAVFNLIPIPPLDGSRLLAAFLPDRIYYSLMRYERYFFLAIIFLLFTDVLDYPISFLQSAIYRLFHLLTFWF